MNNSIKMLSPFVLYCQKVIPLAFDESMSYYECLCALYSYLKDTVVPAVNNNAEALEEVQKAMTELKEYVNTYFENLDVQEEINNKLDDMAESGQLAEIIAQFLEMQFIYGFDTIADMKSGDSYVEGSIIRVLGKTSYSTGDGSYYRVRALTSSDVIDEDNIVALTNFPTLIAEKIQDYAINQIQNEIDAIKEDNYINVKLNGAKGDGVTDDYQIIQNLITNNPHKTIFFPDSTYLISQPLTIQTGNSHQVNLLLGKNAILKTNSTIDSLVEVGTEEGIYDRHSEGSIVTIEGGLFDCENTTQGILLTANQKQTHIKDVTLYNVNTYGIYVDRGINISNSSDALIENVSINGKGSDIGGTGIYFYGIDNKLINSRINNVQIGIQMDGGNVIENVHILGSYSVQTPTTASYEATVGFKINGDGVTTINNSYADTMATAFEIGRGAIVYVDNTLVHYWYVDNSANINIFKFTSGYVKTWSLYASNLWIDCPNSSNLKGINITQTGVNYINFFPVYDNIHLSHINITNPNYLPNDDPLTCLSLYLENSFTTHDPWTQTISANSYYPVALLKDGEYHFEYRNANDQIVDVKINITNNPTIQITNIISNSHVNEYSLAICNAYQDSAGIWTAYLCFKTTSNSTSLNPSFTSIGGWNQQIYTHRDFYNNTALISPTVNAEDTFN